MLHRQDWHFYSNPAPNQKKLISFDFLGDNYRVYFLSRIRVILCYMQCSILIMGKSFSPSKGNISKCQFIGVKNGLICTRLQLGLKKRPFLKLCINQYDSIFCFVVVECNACPSFY